MWKLKPHLLFSISSEFLNKNNILFPWQFILYKFVFICNASQNTKSTCLYWWISDESITRLHFKNYNNYFQSLWRCYAADANFQTNATWSIHIQEKAHYDRYHNKSSSNYNAGSPSPFSRIARRPSFLKKRRVSKPTGNNFFDRQESVTSNLGIELTKTGNFGFCNKAYLSLCLDIHLKPV